MTRRFTETGKWDDRWFRKLPPSAKVMFQFLCDRCDIAGFWEIDMETAAHFTGLPEKEDTALGQPAGESCEGVMEVLTRTPEGGLPKVIVSGDWTWCYVTNFLPQQGNWPITKASNVAVAIKRAFLARKEFGEHVLGILCEKTCQQAPDWFADSGSSNHHVLIVPCLTPTQPLPNPYPTPAGGVATPPGKGKGKGKGKGLGNGEIEGCGGKERAMGVADGARAVMDLWNTFAPKRVESAVEELAIERAYSALVLAAPPDCLTHDQIVGAVENYRMALSVPNSRAHPAALAKWLMPARICGYVPGVFTLEDYDGQRFQRAGPGEEGGHDAEAGVQRLKEKGLL